MKTLFLTSFAWLTLTNCNHYGMLDIMRESQDGSYGFAVFVQGIFNSQPFTDPACVGGTIIQNANCTCNLAAKNKDYLKVGTSFKAWLSDGSTDAVCNIQGFQNNSCSVLSEKGPIIALNGNCPGGDCRNNMSLFAKDLGELLGKGPVAPLFNPPYVGASLMWTGTTATGRNSGNNCGNWATGTATTGDAFRTGPQWTTMDGTASCGGNTASYYCFEEIQ